MVDHTCFDRLITQEPVEGLTFEFRRNVLRVEGDATLMKNDHQIVLSPLKAGDTISAEIYYAD